MMVLNDLMQSWFESKWLKDHPECKIKYEELAENPPHRILGVDVHSYLESLDEFRLSPLYLEMRPVEEVMEWFNKNGNRLRPYGIRLLFRSLRLQYLRTGYLSTLGHG